MGELSFCDFSSLLSLSLIFLFNSLFLLFSFCQRFFLFFVLLFLSFFLFYSFVLTCSRLCTKHLPGLVFFSSNLARVNADGRFELFQFSRDEIQSGNRAGISGSNIREIRSLSGICSDIIKTSRVKTRCLTNYVSFLHHLIMEK